jgi:hypothetical protein
VSAFHKAGWVEEVPGLASLEIEVCEPAVKHTVTLVQLQRWATEQPSLLRSDSDERMRELLAAHTIHGSWHEG